MNNPLFRLGGLCSLLWASLLSAGCDGDPAAEPDRGPVDMIQPDCTEGERRCDAAGRPEVCASGAWASEAVCGEGQSCVDGACATDRVCEPGTSRCADPTTIEVCDAEGEGWEPSPCLDGQCRDVDGAAACSELECVPGMRRCNGEQVIVECSADGTRYDFVETCNGARTGRQCDRGECVELCVLNEKVKTNIGCDYWAADLDNALVPGGDGFLNAARAPYAIVVSNPHPDFTAEVSIYNVDGLVTLDSGTPAQALVPPLGLHVFNLPHRDIDGTGITPRAYRVRSSIPIIAYQFNPLDNEEVFSNDASLLLPSHVLGDEYYVMTREQSFARLRGFLTVIAIGEEPTTVDVTVTAQTQPGPGIPAMTAGESFRAVLQPFEVLNIESGAPGADLTGSYITASADVVVFGGSEAANVPNTNHCINVDPVTGEGVCEASLIDPAIPVTPCRDNYDCNSAGLNTCCADHLEQQLFPTKTWGKKYIATKSYDRGLENDYWRILALEDETKIETVPPQTPVPDLNAGEWFEFGSREHFEIISDKPILVGQFLASEHAPGPNWRDNLEPGDAGTGDPAFILAVPEEQYREDFVFLAPDKYMFDFVSITAPVAAQVFFDDLPVPVEWEPIGDGAEWKIARFAIGDGVHFIRSSEPVSVIVYGYDQYVSYGYPGGLNLDVVDPETGEAVDPETPPEAPMDE
ncbi:MAG: IgGFc-binding protein [Myxococcales bacterium]|nr:IgGFc-binding protein [Myxococcales bacterium]